MLFLLSGLFVSPTKWVTRAGVNPYLGETLQKVQENGCKFYIEETSITPSTSHYLIKGPDDQFEVFGYNSSQVTMAGINTVTGTRFGRNVVRFKDGHTMTFVSPDM